MCVCVCVCVPPSTVRIHSTRTCIYTRYNTYRRTSGENKLSVYSAGSIILILLYERNGEYRPPLVSELVPGHGSFGTSRSSRGFPLSLPLSLSLTLSLSLFRSRSSMCFRARRRQEPETPNGIRIMIKLYIGHGDHAWCCALFSQERICIFLT